MGLSKTHNFVCAMYFYLILQPAESPTFFQMPSINRKEKVKCEECDQEYSRSDAARHKKNCVRGVFSCSECRYFTYNRQEMSYHVAKKKCSINLKAINGLIVLRAGVSELLLPPTTQEKRTCGETTEAK